MDLILSPVSPSLSLLDEIFEKFSCDSPHQEQFHTSVIEQLKQITIQFHEADTTLDSRIIWELEPDTFLIKFVSEPVASYFAKCTLTQAKTLNAHQIPFFLSLLITVLAWILNF